jgi:uncharacterized repeat protein (TIGR01451 family)
MKLAKLYKAGLLLTMLLLSVFDLKGAGIAVGITSSPAVAQPNSNLTFTVSVTNTSISDISTFFITNTLPNSFLFQAAASPSWVPTATNNQIVFLTNVLQAGGFLTTTFTVIPTSAGTFTSTFNFSSPSPPTELTTNVSTTVGGGSTDLGISLSVSSPSVILGDQTSYSIILTNNGPGSAGDFFVTNTLPAGLKFVSITPTTGVTTTNAGKLVIDVPSLGGGSAQTYIVAVTPTNSGILTISAAINPLNVADPNAANNTATASLTVTAPDTNQLSIVVSSPVFNPQTGLFNETVSLSNTSNVALTSARLVVGGLTASNKLYNSVGTNNGNPFVVYANSIAPAETVEFLLEFYYPFRVPQTNLTYTSFGVLQPDLTTTTNGTSLALRIVGLEDGGVLIEFPATRGKTYRIAYSDFANFSNPRLAQPVIVAPADRVQWIDEGPPKTISKPANSTSRFYKVFAQ